MTFFNITLCWLLSPFLIGRMFLCEPSWKYLAKLVGSSLGQLFFANLMEAFVEAISGVQKPSLNMFWEHSPYWMIIASDWLRAELSCEWRKKWMTVSLGFSLALEGICLFVDLWKAQLVSETQNEIVVSWITLWGMMKVYWLDFSLHFQSCCLLRVCHKFGPKLASHYKPVENEVKFGLSEPYSANKKFS